MSVIRAFCLCPWVDINQLSCGSVTWVGSMMPTGSTGRLLSGDFIAVCCSTSTLARRLSWMCSWSTALSSAWYASTMGLYQDVTFGRSGSGSSPLALRLEVVGMEIGEGDDEALVTDALDLIRSVIEDKLALVEELLESLETDDHTSTQTESKSTDVVNWRRRFLRKPESLARKRAAFPILS